MGSKRWKRNGCATCQVPHHSIVPTFPLTLSHEPSGLCDNGQSRINCNNAPGWCCSSRPIPSYPTFAPPQRCTAIPTLYGIGGDAGLGGSFA